jgi:bifunctional oligoribonuclease and PAP phosphatase NrnA
MDRLNDPQRLADFWTRMTAADHVLLATHSSPDGDGFGCQMALQQMLLRAGVEVTVLTAGSIANRFRFLPGTGHAINWDEINEKQKEEILARFDLAIVVDTHKWSMMGSLGPVLKECGKQVLFIDHHQNDIALGDDYYLDADASSTGEICWRLLKTIDLKVCDKVATCLYSAITYDTNSFKYIRQRGETFRVAGELVDAGADTNDIYRNIFASNSLAKVKLIGESLRRIHLEEGGLIAWTSISQDLIDQTGAVPDDMRELITYLLEIDSVEIAITFKDRGNGIFKVSLRSKGRYPIREIARLLGGGGHLFAAGGEAEGDQDTVVARVLAMAREALLNSGYQNRE